MSWRLAVPVVAVVAGCGRSGVLEERAPPPPSPARVPFLAEPRALPTPEHGLVFDGVDDRIEAFQSPTFDIAGALTIEAWILAESVASESHILSHHDDTAEQGWLLMIRAERAAFRMYGNPGQFDVGQTVPDPLSAGVWHHLAGTFDGDRKLTIYVDGMVSQTSLTPASTAAAPCATPFAIGVSTDGGGFPFHGIIDEARVSRGLRYDGPFALPRDRFESDADAVGLWHLDETDPALDSAPNGLDGILGSGPGADGFDPTLVALPPFYAR